MKTKGKTADKNSKPGNAIACAECGGAEFIRTLSEKGSIVRLEYTKDGKAVIETIMKEGKIQFAYCCSKCRSSLTNS